MNGLLQTLRGMGPSRLAIIGGSAAAAILIFVLVVGRLAQGPMSLLYGGLDMQESGQIVAKLDALHVPYELRGNGTQILVPEDQALRLRLSLAQDGLPSGGTIGYEIFDRTDSLGTTNFVQNLNHLRALEGELARTIRAIEGVSNARVHLVLPRREAFSRDTQEPSASILLKMRGVNRLDRQQVLAVENLVAAAVPGLKASHISIVDDRGTLLARSDDAGPGGATSQTNINEVRGGIEDRMRREIEQLVEKSVGAGNVRAEITADVDFDRITTNQELFDPDGQVVRSTQTVAENAASTDQDSGNTVSVGNNLPDAKGSKAGGNKSSSNNGRQEETVNYEISKTIRTQVREAGVIRRVSVAVLVNGVRGTGKDGAKTYTPRSKEELDQIATLVRSAIGFDAKRGDSVEVVNMPFAGIEDLPPPIEELNFFGLGKQDLFRVAEMLVLGIVALLVLLLVVRPLLQRALAPRPVDPAAPSVPMLPDGSSSLPALPGGVGSELTPLSSEVPRNNIEAMIDIARVEGQVKASSLKKIGEIVEKHPEEAVAIVRNWLYQDT